MREKRPDRLQGAAQDAFWEWCAKKQLRLPACKLCRRLAWPITDACEYCGGSRFEWARISGRGKLVSWCSFEQDYYKGLLPVPYDTILVELEEGPLFISNPSGFSNSEASCGMSVRLSFLSCEDSAGPFELPVFERM
jgi:uncharacterized OB-fold protein